MNQSNIKIKSSGASHIENINVEAGVFGYFGTTPRVILESGV